MVSTRVASDNNQYQIPTYQYPAKYFACSFCVALPSIALPLLLLGPILHCKYVLAGTKFNCNHHLPGSILYCHSLLLWSILPIASCLDCQNCRMLQRPCAAHPAPYDTRFFTIKIFSKYKYKYKHKYKWVYSHCIAFSADSSYATRAIFLCLSPRRWRLKRWSIHFKKRAMLHILYCQIIWQI